MTAMQRDVRAVPGEMDAFLPPEAGSGPGAIWNRAALHGGTVQIFRRQAITVYADGIDIQELDGKAILEKASGYQKECESLTL